MHPDAESLTAFAEQLLPAAERDQILSAYGHVSPMPRSRIPGTAGGGEDQPEPVTAVVAHQRSRVRHGSALELGVDSGSGVCGNHRGCGVCSILAIAATETQMDAKLSQTDSLQASGACKGAATSQAGDPSDRRLQKAQKATHFTRVRDGARCRSGKDQMKQLDEKKSIEQNELALGPAHPRSGVSGRCGRDRCTERWLRGRNLRRRRPLGRKSVPAAEPGAPAEHPAAVARPCAADAANKPAIKRSGTRIGVRNRDRAGRDRWNPTPSRLRPAATPGYRRLRLIEPEIRRGCSKVKEGEDIAAQRAWDALPWLSEAGRSIALDTSRSDVSERRRRQTLAADSHAVDGARRAGAHPAGRDSSLAARAPHDAQRGLNW